MKKETREIKEKVKEKWMREANNPYRWKQSTYKYPEPVPGMKTAPSHLSTPQVAVKKLNSLINNGGGETEVHKLLLQYPCLLPFLMDNTGHYGTWYVSKPQICPPLINGKKGKIPDFLLAGENSYGLHWYVVELKSPNDLLFDRNGEAFSLQANKGLNQLARYQRYAEQHQGTLRDTLEIKDFVTPQGILLIGNEKETRGQDSKEQLKSFWNEALIDIEIMSYSRLLHRAREVAGFSKRKKKSRKTAS